MLLRWLKVLKNYRKWCCCNSPDWRRFKKLPMLCCCAGSEYSKITENDVVATALTGGVFKNYRKWCCCNSPDWRSIQKLSKVMLLQQPWLAEYSKITQSDVVATALTGEVFKNYPKWCCCNSPDWQSIQKLPKVMLWQQPWLAEYSKITKSDVVATALTGDAFENYRRWCCCNSPDWRRRPGRQARPRPPVAAKSTHSHLNIFFKNKKGTVVVL